MEFFKEKLQDASADFKPSFILFCFVFSQMDGWAIVKCSRRCVSRETPKDWEGAAEIHAESAMELMMNVSGPKLSL